jgi:hypothetical protein
VPTGQPTLGRLNSAVSCLNNRAHYTRRADGGGQRCYRLSWRIARSRWGGRPPTASMCHGAGCRDPAEGAARDEHYHDRTGHRQDGLFAKGKFCLTRRGELLLPQCRGRSGADRAGLEVGSIVPRGSRPLGVGHEAAAVDGSPAAGRPSNSATAVGQGLSVASAGHSCARQPIRTPGRSAGRRGGEPPCR